MEAAELLATLRDLEVALHQPAVRSDRGKLGGLLHPQFREFGRSGAEYSREDALVEFESAPPSYHVWSQDFRVEELAPGVALLTYRSAHLCADGRLDRHTNRTSVWQLTPSGWKMRFHQGTATGQFAKQAT